MKETNVGNCIVAPYLSVHMIFASIHFIVEHGFQRIVPN